VISGNFELSLIVFFSWMEKAAIIKLARDSASRLEESGVMRL
jgi:hypothetical protein